MITGNHERLAIENDAGSSVYRFLIGPFLKKAKMKGANSA